jgi:hypothetical protein
MSYTPTFDGNAMFGEAVSIVEIPNAAAYQAAAFFGVEGVLATYAGTRGRIFQVSGLFTGPTPYDVISIRYAWNSYIGAPGTTLVDTMGIAWYPVIFRGEIQVEPGGPRAAATAGGGSWALPYKMVLQGLA